MSTLNLALQHVALARKQMEPDFEDMLKSKNLLSDVRKVLQTDNPGFQEALLDSMQQPIKILNDRFRAMKINKEQAVGVGFAASMDEINKTLDFCIETDKDLTPKIIKESVPLQNKHTAICQIMFFK